MKHILDKQVCITIFLPFARHQSTSFSFPSVIFITNDKWRINYLFICDCTHWTASRCFIYLRCRRNSLMSSKKISSENLVGPEKGEKDEIWGKRNILSSKSSTIISSNVSTRIEAASVLFEVFDVCCEKKFDQIIWRIYFCKHDVSIDRQKSCGLWNIWNFHRTLWYSFWSFLTTVFKRIEHVWIFTTFKKRRTKF